MKNKTRMPRTKEMLLPLPGSNVRSISLENHLALATMRSGHGTTETMVALLRVLYMTYYLLERDCTEAELADFRQAEVTLDRCIRAASEKRGWHLPEEVLPAIEQVLRRSDEIVGSVPKYRYVEAWERLERFVRSGRLSPLPGSGMMPRQAAL
ncbi:hypothetical protein [Paraburkholderia sp. J12]|uniref:hypothetical protein n=1 Tax=Paraburkholderia sp. J12 TaxID=2805432 RepID=UPI002ABE067C|nr:hypothetical protein [Paraburkholderia sp. J12]